MTQLKQKALKESFINNVSKDNSIHLLLAYV